MEEGDPEMGLQHLAQAARLAQLLQRAAAQRVPITLPNAQGDLEPGAEHMASIVLQCRLRAKELGEDLCEVDFDGKLEAVGERFVPEAPANAGACGALHP